MVLPTLLRGEGRRDGLAALRCWPLLLVNGLSGPVLGVACFQHALRSTPSAVVLAIVATTPLLAMPLSWRFERDRPSAVSVAGAVAAVLGVGALFLGA
jgi:drug/metabolite transporter (DMT)-like permease